MKRRTLIGGALCAGLLGETGALRAAETRWDVIVVGSGLAGLSAAASALENGAKSVLVLEKGPLIGGHSLMSSGSLAAVSPKRQGPQGIEDSVERLLEDSRQVGLTPDEKLIRTIGEQSEDALDWLAALGVVFSSVVFQSLAGMHPRCVAASGAAAGRTYVLAVNRHVRALGGAVRLCADVTGMTRTDDGWLLTGTDHEAPAGWRARNVILATGGFTANVGMRMRYDARLDGTIRTSANPRGDLFDGATGDGIVLGEKAGAALRTMDDMILLPFWGGRLLDYVGGDIYINSDGRRFVNEAASWGTIADAILALPDRALWVITDSRSHKGTSLGIKLANGTVTKSPDIESMAAGMKIPSRVLRETLDEYNRAAKAGFDPVTGKSVFTQCIDSPPYYWGREELYAHMTLGGLAADEKARVLTPAGEPIPGLYAAGETVGGIYGRDRVGGLSLMNCLVFGRIAGKEAAY